MQYSYKTRGVCSQNIIIDMDGDTVRKVEFVGGCPGNTIGVARLSEGRNIDEVIGIVDGIRCGAKPTSCPDQLAKALKSIKDQRAQA
ncbi:MAG: TIGR03905 family TSCPD domain-containing protein [Oscillospiraceae bacterium]|nr:TIGR03905 family TSCPD domain-containing protein [Oscillospiraceae bacterium]